MRAGSHQEPPGIDAFSGVPLVQILPQFDDLAGPQADVPRIVQPLGGVDRPAVANQKVIFHYSRCLPLGACRVGAAIGIEPRPGKRICQMDSGDPFYHAWACGPVLPSRLAERMVLDGAVGGSGRGKAPGAGLILKQKKKELSTKGHEERRRATKALRLTTTGCQGREGMVDF